MSFGSSPASQGLTLGYTVGSQGSSPQKKVRQEEKFACLPVTIRSIDVGTKSSEGGDLRIHGEEVGMLLVVGVVESIVKQAASFEFVVNDGTGRIKARHYFTEMKPELENVDAGKYVSLVANVRTAPALHLGVQFMAPIDSPDVISYHMIEAAHAALKIQRAGSFPSTPAAKRMIASPQASDSGTPWGADLMSPQKNAKVEIAPVKMEVDMKTESGGDLKKAVLECLKAQANGEAGLALSEIAAKFPSAQMVDVKKHLADLVDEGDAFTTIDDDHFASV
jgi:hypothetical protein